jgi:hypothetical protein
MHTVTVDAATLNATTAQMLITNSVGSHTHMVTLGAVSLASLRMGGTVDVLSSSAGTPAHTHTYRISCT